jgi:hypothetical protein
MSYNPIKLFDELVTAGLPVTEVHSELGPTYSRALTSPEQTTAAAVIAAHDPTPYPDYAVESAKQATEIYKLTPNQAVVWSEKQIIGDKSESALTTELDAATTVAALKPVILSIIQMNYRAVKTEKSKLRLLVALRDKIMPGL